MKKKLTKEKKDEALKTLRKYCRPGTTIYTTLRHVARSGMSRCIDLYVYRNNKPICLSYDTAIVLGEKLDRKWNSICVGGCGMDMGFDLVYRLSYALHGHESKGDGIDADERGIHFTPRLGHYRAGYSLKHEWQ